MSNTPAELEQKYSDVVAILWDKFKVNSADDISRVLLATDAVCMACGYRDDNNRRQHQPCGQCGHTYQHPGDTPIGSLGPYHDPDLN